MKEQKQQMGKLMGLFIIIIMAGSVLGVFVWRGGGDSETGLPENAFQISGYTFYELDDGTFGTQLENFLTPQGQPLPILFRLDPNDAQNISIDSESIDNILGADKIYLAYNPNSENVSKIVLAAVQVSRVIPVVKGIKPIPAYTEDDTPIDLNVPLKTCADASDGVTVILFETADKTQIIFDEGCVHVQGKDLDELILAADKLGMWLVGLDV